MTYLLALARAHDGTLITFDRRLQVFSLYRMRVPVTLPAE